MTNYKMLDYLLIRPADFPIWKENTAETLKYLIVDELHTFDGAQGTDLACLIRRLKERLKVPERHLCCVGTSATLGGSDRADALIKYASDVFGQAFDEDAIVTESLVSAQVFAGDRFITRAEMPPVSVGARLDPMNFTSVEDYLSVQHELWFGEVIANFNDDQWRVKLSDELLQHMFFRNLLLVFQGEGRFIEDLNHDLEKIVPDFAKAPENYKRTILSSILALVSSARVQSGINSDRFWMSVTNCGCASCGALFVRYRRGLNCAWPPICRKIN